MFEEFTEVEEVTKRVEQPWSGMEKPYREDEPVPRELYNQRDPAYVLKAERPEHRVIVMMSAAGMGNKEIADALTANGTPRSPTYVSYVRKQPWAVKQILEEIERAGREPVRVLLQGAAYEAAERLIDLARNARQERTKLAANEAILDRVFGKATTPIMVSQGNPDKMTDDELRAIAARARVN